jgi:hypothetical protein
MRGDETQAVRITHPHHPLSGQIVTVLRWCQRKQGGLALVIPMPDGTQGSIPASWTEPVTDTTATTAANTEPLQLWVNAQTLLSLSKLVSALMAHPDRERRCSDGALPDPGRDDP